MDFPNIIHYFSDQQMDISVMMKHRYLVTQIIKNNNNNKNHYFYETLMLP